MSGLEAERTERDITRLVAALGDPTRRRAFFAVRDAGVPIGKDEVASQLGIDRRLAGFHLDKLVQQGFLTADFRRRNGRSGPGAGRPAKVYAVAHPDVAVSLPERHYDLLASLLLRAMRDGGGESPQRALERVGYEFGLGLGRAEREAGRGPSGPGTTEAVAGVVRLLSRYGFAAQAEGADAIRARACPFEEVAFGDPERICGLDRAIWRGVLAAFAPGATLGDATSRAGGDEACLVHVTSSS